MERNSRQDGFWRGFSVVLLVVLIALVAFMYVQRKPQYIFHESKGAGITSQLASLATGAGGADNIYWVSDLAERALPFVVNVQTSIKPSTVKKASQDQGQDDESTRRLMEQMQQMMPFGGQGIDPRQFQQQQPQMPEDGKLGEGSGFIIREDGYVVTNAHVVDGGDSFKILTNDGKEYDGELVGTDSFKDIAVIKIKANGQKFTAATLGASTKTRIGEPVIAIGSPLGLKASVTAGIISTTERSRSDLGGNTDIRSPQKYLQTDAAINRGNSGGPLLNARGEVIGINQAIARWDNTTYNVNNEGGMVPIEGIGFAIPIDEVKTTITQIVEHGKVVYPGISATISSLKDFMADNERHGVKVDMKVKDGVYVQAVTVGGPAARAGIEGGDVILSINGTAVSSGEQLITEIGKFKVGDRVKMRVARQGGEQQEDVSVVLSELDTRRMRNE